MDNIYTEIPGYLLFSVKKININNIEINYADAGQGYPLIFIHGWTNNWMGFIPLGKYLMKYFRVILIDLPGYGDSGRLKNYSLDIMCHYLHGFINKLGLKQFSLVGHSIGTFVVSAYYRLYPQDAEKLVLIGPVIRKKRRFFFFINKLFFELIKKSDKLKMLLKSLIDCKAWAYLIAKHINMYRFDQKLIDYYGMVGKKKMSKEVYAELGAEVSGIDIEDQVRNISAPVLMLFGKYDKITCMEEVESCMDYSGNINFAVIDKAGHIVTVEKPKETAEAIKKFILNN